MVSDSTIATLNRLSVVLNRSLLMYLSDARPYFNEKRQGVPETLAAIVDEQREMVARIGTLVVDEGSTPDVGAFPLQFTGLHDLSFEYLLVQLIRYQEADIAIIERCAADLATAPMARALAEEALGAAKGHLESLQELRVQVLDA